MPLDEPQIRECAHKLLSALDYLHRQGVIHRDLKAGNVLLCANGEIKLGITRSTMQLLTGKQFQKINPHSPFKGRKVQGGFPAMLRVATT
jgi:hypothetical protein